MTTVTPNPTDRVGAKANPAALRAWREAVLRRARNVKPAGPYDREAFTLAAVRSLVKLSVHDDGPRRVRQALSELGVSLVVEAHLPGAPLDGAAMRRADGTPVIALTLRRDRIDDFWFTVIHELAHVVFHLGDEAPVFLDDLGIPGAGEAEALADRLARQALVPDDIWATFDKGAGVRLPDILECARQAAVHPALVAGRWRAETGNVRRFARLLGRGTIGPQIIGEA